MVESNQNTQVESEGHTIPSEDTRFINQTINQNTRKRRKTGFSPLAYYKGLIGRFFILHKHFLALLVGSRVAHVNNLPDFKRKGLRSAASRMFALFARPFLRGELRNEDFPVQLRRRLELLGPTYVKLGQIMAIREDILPKEITDELKQLLDRVPAVPFEMIKEIIEESVGMPIRQLFLNVEEEAFGSASLAQTHLATTRAAETVVLKVIKPGIRETVDTDIKLLLILATFLQWVLPRYQPKVIINEFCVYTEKELDLIYEADHAEIFAANFEDEPDVVFPKIYRDLSSRDVLCMELLSGIKPTDPRVFEFSQQELQKIVSLGTGAIIKMLYEDGFFHADLHAGNLLILPGPKVGFIDLGMVGRFDDRLKRNMLFYFHYLVNGDIENSAFYLLKTAKIGRNGDPVGFKRAVSDLSLRYRLHTAHGRFSLAQLILESLNIGARFRVFFPVEMTLMVKALVTFEGVGLMLDPHLDVPKLSREHIQKVYAARYNPRHMIDQLARGLPELVDVIMRFPKLLADGARSLDDFLNEEPRDNPLGNLSGLTSSLMAGACIVGGTIAIVQGGHPLLWLGLFASSIIFYFFGK